MMLDLMHTVGKFWRDLPERVEEFRSIATEAFPSMLDTKWLLSNQSDVVQLFNRGGGTALGEAFDVTSRSPFPTVKFDFGARGAGCQEKAQEHDAAYDAFMTGAIFARVAGMIAKQRGLSEPLLPSHETFEEFHNQVFLMYSLYPCMSFTADQGPPDVAHAFLVELVQEMGAREVASFFEPLGGATLRWADDKRCVCLLKVPERANEVMSSLVTDTCQFKVSPVSTVFSTQSEERPHKRSRTDGGE
eukprot:CAMPEP_0175901844 /NCGR_PEP_ID=MMETSP0108-20121206/3077_1 /TAXON_ID=195067 ORGANISM="Goniomonas pacifica, Strain CCMP1869" /NCGR_SAMPLE_ID=MMETSP0108 /ASSEMBLY_ACC=CAM_ASM_000204 /LENGTH=245 /DNA_ID=CAMNT_0017223451 /DNA_START=226 /DNA_END=963 /DNA_ORIENTATION=+